MLKLRPIAVLQMLICSAVYGGDPISDETVRATVEKSLGYIVESGVDWIEQRECVSCHQVPFMLWSLNRAADSGMDVDPVKLATWNDWGTNWKHFAAPKAREGKTENEELSGNVDILYQMLLGRRNGDAGSPWVEQFAGALVSSPEPDGTWQAGGQLPFQKRPKPETHGVTSLWILYTLALDQPTDLWRPLYDRAMPQLELETPAVSTEWWAVRLLLAEQVDDRAMITDAAGMLLTHQNSDGGWGWLLEDSSDALGTGIALYALARKGGAERRDAIRKGQQFLSRTQQDDGSWAVPGTKAAKANRVEETSTYWGTCWAVIGLLETVDP